MTNTITVILSLFLAMSLSYGCEGNGPSPSAGDDSGDAKKEEKLSGMKLTASSSKTINPDIFGYNTQSIKGPGWDNADFISKITELNPSNFRYPGGTVGNFWDWETGYYNEKGKEVNVISTSSVYPYKLNALKTVYTKTGAVPVFMLNLLTDTYEHQLAMLKYAASIGLPVKYIEMGNEYYLDDHPAKYNYLNVFPEITDYAKTCREWTSGLHAEFPDAKISIIGVSTPSNWNRVRAKNWNSTMMANMNGIVADAFTIHIYPKFGSSLNYTPNVYDMLGQALAGVKESKVLDSSIDSKYKLWVTEFNFESGSNPFPGRWIHGIVATLMSAELICIPRVEIIDFFNLTTGLAASAIYESDQKIDGGTAPKNSLSASGEGLKMLSKAQKGMTSVCRVGFASNPTVSTVKNGNINTLYGYLFSDGSSSRMLMVNAGEKEQTVSLSGLSINATKYEQTFASKLETAVCGSSSLTHQTKTISDGNVTLRPYSITVIY